MNREEKQRRADQSGPCQEADSQVYKNQDDIDWDLARCGRSKPSRSGATQSGEASTKDPAIIRRVGRWAITSQHLFATIPGTRSEYAIPLRNLVKRRGDLYEVPLHMATKSWVDLDEFQEAFTEALAWISPELDSQIDRALLIQSFDLERIQHVQDVEMDLLRRQILSKISRSIRLLSARRSVGPSFGFQGGWIKFNQP